MLIFIIQVKADLIPIDVDQLKVFPLLTFIFLSYPFLSYQLKVFPFVILSNLILSTEAQPAELSGQLSHSRYFGECQRKGDHV